MPIQYIIICSVSGGVTGSRSSPLKDNGEVVYFNSEEEAEWEANRLRQSAASRRVSLYSGPQFGYTVTTA